VSWPAISQHLGVLKDAGLIRERRDGRRRLYTADPETLGPLEALLTSMWRTNLQELASLVEAEEGDDNS
jgi:DNA-binding transcriptional ArsR family regulator